MNILSNPTFSKGLLAAGTLVDFDEYVQDSIGGIRSDTATINFTYTDATPSITADVIRQMSITADGSGLKLDGDSATPGNTKYYGTDSGGTKGWYTLATADIQTLLDGIGSTHGDVLYRNGSDWVALAAGTAGQFFRTGGAGANPSWLGSADMIAFLATANDAAAMAALGGTTVGISYFTLANPSAITFPRMNADNTVSALDAATFRTAIGAGSGSGTVTSVAMTVPTELAIAGTPVTTSGTLALTWGTAGNNKFIASPADSSTGAYAGRVQVVADLPALNGFSDSTFEDADRVPFYDASLNANRDCAASAMRSFAVDNIVVLRDEKTQNTAGGTFTSGAWQVRTLNTEASDASSLCTLSSNQFTLVAGTYEIHATAPGFYVNRHQAKLYNATDASDIIIGTSEMTHQNASGYVFTTRSVVRGRFTIAASKALEIRHQCQTTQATNGFGYEANFTTECYTEVFLRRVA